MKSAIQPTPNALPTSVADGLAQLADAFSERHISIASVTLVRGKETFEHKVEEAVNETSLRMVEGRFENVVIQVACISTMRPDVNAELQSITTTAATAAGNWTAPAVRLTLVKSRPGTSMLGNSGPMRELIDDINRASRSTHAALVLGESGTGKTTAAAMIHERSARAAHPFVDINCAALPDSLIESELFGYEKGAFTGAVTQKKGLFESAEQGTLFLDEIGELKPELQAKLLTAIEQQKIRRLGGTKDIKCDVRIIAASSRDLRRMVAEGKFREDLYYRLAVLEISIVPLRDRQSDIPQLIHDRLNQEQTRASLDKPFKIEGGAIKLLAAYHWPGNIRQLHNAIARLATRAYDGTPITTAAARTELSRFNQKSTSRPLNGKEQSVLLPDECRILLPNESLQSYVARVQRVVVETVREEAGEMKIAAERLGYNRAALTRLLSRVSNNSEQADEVAA